MLLPGWYDDPFGRHEQRFHDGNRWAPYVRDGDVASMDAPVSGSQPTAGGAPAGTAGTVTRRRFLLDEPVLVVRQRAKLVELVDEYDVLDAAGTPIGSVREVGQGAGRSATCSPRAGGIGTTGSSTSPSARSRRSPSRGVGWRSS